MIGINVINSANYININAPDNSNIYTINKSLVDSIGMYYQENCVNGLGQSNFAYGRRTPSRTTKTIINIRMSDQSSYSFDCDEVINQPTWQGCTKAALIQAQSDISSWL